ncbi:MAG TPA: hypothetical protein VH914_19935 [Acidimicrobiia bacterium]|nr:hypothetical protein [Acidimicrobiia bacterium]
MFDTITSTRRALEELAASFEPRTLTNEQATRVVDELDAAAQQIFRSRRKAGPHESLEAYSADALAELVLAEPTERRSATIAAHVVIDHVVLVRGNAIEGERCEIPGVGPVNVEWVRDLLGEAFVTAIVKKGRNVATVAHFGRHVPAHLRTAMIVGGRECDIEGCHNRGYLELDHSDVDFADGGPAALWNLDWCRVPDLRGVRARERPDQGAPRVLRSRAGSRGHAPPGMTRSVTRIALKFRPARADPRGGPECLPST